MVERFQSRLGGDLPGARGRVLDVEPALGAVRLAIRAARGDAVVPVYVNE
jgi:hypothetical protein